MGDFAEVEGASYDEPGALEHDYGYEAEGGYDDARGEWGLEQERESRAALEEFILEDAERRHLPNMPPEYVEEIIQAAGATLGDVYEALLARGYSDEQIMAALEMPDPGRTPRDNELGIVDGYFAPTGGAAERLLQTGAESVTEALRRAQITENALKRA